MKDKILDLTKNYRSYATWRDILPSEALIALKMWTIYDHPKDYPNFFVARMFYICPIKNEPLPSNLIYLSSDLKTLQKRMQSLFLTCISRHDTDDPTIIETWL